MTEDFKDFPPEDRLKKLKELKERKKKEIEEAQKLIKESEQELQDNAQYKEKIPIPEVMMLDLKGLSLEGKELLKLLKQIKDEKKKDPLDKEDHDDDKKDEKDSDVSTGDLEETVSKEQILLPPEVLNTEYAMQLSHKPMQDLYHEMTHLYGAVQEKGYISEEDQRRITYLAAGVERKMEAIEDGSYDSSKDLSDKLAGMKQISAHMLNQDPHQFYKAGGSKHEGSVKDRYAGHEHK